MVVTVKFIGAFRSMSGKSRLALKFEKTSSLRETLNEIIEKAPGLKQALSDPKSRMLILINGKEISVLKGLDTLLKDEDEVVFVPVLHGG
jgi:molybdopterin converting factor small subunit